MSPFKGIHRIYKSTMHSNIALSLFIGIVAAIPAPLCSADTNQVLTPTLTDSSLGTLTTTAPSITVGSVPSFTSTGEASTTISTISTISPINWADYPGSNLSSNAIRELQFALFYENLETHFIQQGLINITAWGAVGAPNDTIAVMTTIGQVIFTPKPIC